MMNINRVEGLRLSVDKLTITRKLLEHDRLIELTCTVGFVCGKDTISYSVA